MSLGHRTVKVWELKSFLPPGHINTDSWGLVTKDTFPEAKHVAVYLTEMRPDARSEPHVHPKSDHVYFIISGRGEFTVAGETFEAGPNECIYIPPNTEHSLIVKGRETLRFIVLMAPPP